MNCTKILLNIIAVSLITTITINAQEDGALQSRTNENNMRFAIPNDIKSKLDTLCELFPKKYLYMTERF